MRLASLPRPAIVAVGFVVGALLLLAIPHGWLFRPPPPAPGSQGAAGDGRRWACPMFCTMADEPGLCPVCGMDMEPVQDQGDRVPLTAFERMQAGIRTEPVRKERAVARVRAYGKIRHDERLEGHVTAWVGGRLDELYVDFTGTVIHKGDPVASIYAPELVSAQEELISAAEALAAARTTRGARYEERLQNAETLYRAARRRLLLLGLPEEAVVQIEREKDPSDHVTIVANESGTVVVKHVKEGHYVKTGDPLFTVVDLSIVWGMLEVFERDAGAVFEGQHVEVHVPSLPGEAFEGDIAFIDPVLDERRRVLPVRVDLPNPDGRLKPGSFVDADIHVELSADGRVVDPKGDATPGDVLLVPRSAVLQGGERDLVYVMAQPPGPMEEGRERWPAVYEPRVVETGFRVGEDLLVLSGLRRGDQVVTRGQFLIDSQLQLTGKPSLMIPQAAAGIAPADPHAGH